MRPIIALGGGGWVNMLIMPFIINYISCIDHMYISLESYKILKFIHLFLSVFLVFLILLQKHVCCLNFSNKHVANYD
jgi:hypothetical protein